MDRAYPDGMEKNKHDQEREQPEPVYNPNAIALDEAEDSPEHMIEEESPLAWAHRLAEEEAAGLD